MCPDLGPLRPADDVLAERRREALPFQGRGTHLLDQDVEFFLGLAYQFVRLGEVGLGRVRVLLDQSAGRGDLERGREDLLFDGVVQVAGEAVAGFQRAKLSPRLEQVFQLGRHVVELATKLAELIPRTVLRRHGEVAPAPRAGRAGETSYATGQAPGGKEPEEGTQKSGRNRQEDRADPHRDEERRCEVRQPQRANENPSDPALLALYGRDGYDLAIDVGRELARVLLAVECGVHQWLEAGDTARVEPPAFGEASHLRDGDQQAASVVDYEESALVRRVIARAHGWRRGPIGPPHSGTIGEAHQSLSYGFRVRRILVQGSLETRRHFVSEVLHHQPRQQRRVQEGDQCAGQDQLQREQRHRGHERVTERQLPPQSPEREDLTHHRTCLFS